MSEVGINWANLVHERDAWVARNFPEFKLDSPMDESIIGVLEEQGELCRAHLKAAQNIRGSSEKHEADAKDAVGDITIYLLGVMSQLGKLPSRGGVPIVKSPTWALKYLGYHTGQLAVNPSQYGCEMIIAYLESYCDFMDWDYTLIVLNTWNEVKQRDWIRYPDTGLPPIGEERTAA